MIRSAFNLGEARQEKLRLAWYGSHSMGVLACSFGLSSWQAVRSFWLVLQDQGRLPAGPRAVDAPPAFVPAPVPVAPPVCADVADEDDDVEPPLEAMFGARIPDSDPLLMTLRHVHGRDAWRELDGMPSRLLQDERCGVTPSRLLLRELARIRDLFVAALMERRAPRRRICGASS